MHFAVIHLLVIAGPTVSIPPLAALSATGEFKVLQQADVVAARPLVETGLFDACLMAVDALTAETGRSIAAFRALAPLCPLVIARSRGTTEAEDAAYLAGADAILPVSSDPGALRAVVQRLATAGVRAAPVPVFQEPAPSAAPSPLAVMRDVSQVLSYSLDYREFTRQFAFKLREIIGAARVAIFLETTEPAGALDLDGSAAASRLPCAGAVGLPAGLAECFELSRKSGLGRRIHQTGRILRRGSESVAPFTETDPRLDREFEVLGCEIAIPVNDRERTIGVAVLGGRLTGAPFSDAELLLVYHLMEELGLAVRNSRLHHELSSSHRLFSDVLEAMTSGALVVGADGSVRFANHALRKLLGGGDGDVAPGFALSQLPTPLQAALHDAVEHGRAAAPFFHEHAGPPPRVLRASVIPFPATTGTGPRPALLLLEDFTQIRAAQRAEIEASNLKLIGLIARRFAHEIRNSLVPLTTHQQLFDSEYASAEFRDSLKHALTRETSRIQRFTEQMLFLAQPERGPTDILPLGELLQASFDRSREFLGEPGELEIQSELPDPRLRCHGPSLAHALQEIFLNGLQSAGAPTRVTVSMAPEAEADGRPGLAMRVHDSGRGFAPEVAARAADPFYTTRNTGVGLGLTVAKRVIEAHAGRLEIRPRARPEDPDLVIHLPLNL